LGLDDQASYEGAPYGLQLDLLSIIARLRQIREDDCAFMTGSEHGLTVLLWERIMTCDLPRLEGHLTPETVAWMERSEESWRK
jgi:hypothetical protein